MFRNYCRTAWRNLTRYRLFSVINVVGLSVGIACALLIILHIKEELSYDKGYTKAGRMFRITMEGLNDQRHWAATAPSLGREMAKHFPGIVSNTRLYRYNLHVFSYTAPGGEVRRFEEKGGFVADTGAVNMFDLQFAAGNPATALAETDAIVITPAFAKKYFGNENPLGKVLMDDAGKYPLRVTGLLKPAAFPSHLQFDYLVSMPTIHRYTDERSLENRTWNGFYNYVLLDRPQSKAEIEAHMSRFLLAYYANIGETPQELLAGRRLHLQPVTDIHLHSGLEKEMSANGDISYIYIFSAAALLILLVAAVNFVNICTAQAFNRVKEIGLRKVAGAQRSQVLGQFLGESLFITLLAALLALVLFRCAMPFYGNLIGKTVNPAQFLTATNLAIFTVLIIVIGVLAGLYPALFVAGFDPVTSLKGKRNAAPAVNGVRKGLIIFQFVVSVFMLFSSIVMYRQMHFFHTKDLGFDKEQLVAVRMYDDMWKQFGAMRNDLQRNPAIAGYAVTSNLPGERFGMQGFRPLDVPFNDVAPSVRAMWADEKLLPELKVPVVEGRNFVNQFPDIRKKEFILNETAMKYFGMKDPIGQRCVLDQDTGTIVGLAKDFNFASLHAEVEPLVIHYNPFRANYLLVKAHPHRLPQVLQFLDAEIKRLSPTSVFSYSFVDERLERLYSSENRMMQLFRVFSIFAVFVSCLGLFGLAAYASRLRTKEVGIRKVLGASVYHVIMLLSFDFLKLVLLATLIAWPLAWWVMSRWLDGFAYRISISGWMFVASGCLALLVALVTVCFQAAKAALVNPVRSLKAD